MNKRFGIILTSSVLIISIIFLIKIFEIFLYSNITAWVEMLLLSIFSFLFFIVTSSKFKSYRETIKNYKTSLDIERYNINERMKELTCLYKVNEYSQDEEMPRGEYFKSIAGFISNGMQFTDNSNCEIVYEGKSYLANSRDKKVFLESPIELKDKVVGKIIVYYDKELSFLKEETDLLNAISKIISKRMMSSQKRIEIKNLIQKFEDFEFFVNESAIVSKTDSKGNINYVNKKFSDVSGWSIEEVFGKNHRLLNSGVHDKSTWSDMYRSTVIDKKIWNKVITNRNKNGSLYYVDTYVKADFDNDGKLIGFSSIRQDITDVKKKEQEITNRMNAINRSNAVIEFDMDGNIKYANDLFLTTMGYDSEEIVGKHHSMFLFEQDKNSEEYKTFWENLRSGSHYSGEVIRRKKDGSLVFLQTTYNPILSVDGKPYRIMKIATDITLNVMQQKEIEKKNTYLEHAAKIIRHDMHSGINTYIPRGITSLDRRLTEDKAIELKIDAPLKMIREGLKHTQKVYKGVYEFTNLVKKDAVLNRDEIDLKLALSDYLMSTVYYSQVDISDLGKASVNEALFCTAIDNLIRNGLKYNDSDNKAVKIYRKDNHLFIEDNGRGMSYEDFKLLSQPYTRKEGQKESGTGLGLNICTAILEEHGFDVYCDKIKSGGTQIKIKIK